MVTRRGFEPTVNKAFAGFGFPAEAAQAAFPLDMFLPGSDLTPLEKEIDTVIDGLTSWKPEAKREGGEGAPSRIVVEGRDYEDALAKMGFLFLKNLWSDGLPIVPATEEHVDWLLTGTDLPRSKVVGEILPRRGIATVEVIATAAAMAGCRPEYMPVLIAALEAILDPLVYHQHMQASTGDAHPAVIVNGPVAKQIRLNSGYGCLGPSSAYPAGASIGRAIRFLLMNVGGSIPGAGAMALYGGPGRYTGLVFAEDEEGLPSDWKPLNVDLGCSGWRNTVTVLPTSGGICVWEGAALNEKEALLSLDNFAGYMRVPYAAYFGPIYNPHGAPGILLVGRGAAQGFSKLGWSKEKVKVYLWEHTKFSESDWLTEKLDLWIRGGLSVKEYVKYPLPIAVSSKNLMIVVAGGEQAGHSYWLQVHGGCFGPAIREINLPKSWEALLKKAEEDLGGPPP